MLIFLIFTFTKLTASLNLDQSVYFPYYIEPVQEEQKNFNVCPELFYFFNYVPFIKAQPYTLTLQTYPEKTNKKKRSISKFKSQIKQNYDRKYDLPPAPVPDLQNDEYLIEEAHENQADGPFYSIVSETYETCCSLNINRLTPVRVKDDVSLYKFLFETYSNETHILHHRAKGIFSIFELSERVNNPNLVTIITSPSFYLVTKREHNGAPTFTPIAITILEYMYSM